MSELAEVDVVSDQIVTDAAQHRDWMFGLRLNFLAGRGTHGILEERRKAVEARLGITTAVEYSGASDGGDGGKSPAEPVQN